jgi:multiple sugar transport system permease protein
MQNTKTTPLAVTKDVARRGSFVERWLHVIFPAPAVIIICVLMIYPIAYLVMMSFRDYATSLTEYTDVGFKWYQRMLVDPRFAHAAGLTINYTVAAVIAEMGLGVIMALILNRDFKGVGLVRTLFLLPMVATPVASILIWSTMFDPSMGVLNWFLEILHLPRSVWLADPTTVIPSLLIVEVWMGSPFVMLLILAGIKNMPVEPFECAQIDGANFLQRFMHLTIPMIRPTIVVAALFRLIDTLKQFPVIWILTQGGPSEASETLYVYGYSLSFRYLELGYGSAVLVSLVLMLFIISLFWMRARERSWV